VVTVRIDQPNDGDELPDDRDQRPDAGEGRPDAADTPGERETDAAADAGPARGTVVKRDDASQSHDASAARVARNLEYRTSVEAADRAYAIDRGYARVKEIEEKTVTPAMRRIEAEDPDRHLAGLENRLKGKDRLAEKVTFDMQKKGLKAEEALANVKDSVRYTFEYSEDGYTRGVYADCDRLQGAGYEFVERRNSWAYDEYKGINSRWRAPANGQLFEVQFHTQASREAKEETHWAYEKLRVGSSPQNQQELQQYQREVTARVPVPPGAPDIPDYP
jgi:hypothetical protein